MSDSTERPATEDNSPTPPSRSIPPGAPILGGREAESDVRPSNHADGAVPEGPGPGNDPTEELKRGLEKTRLPADLKAQILAELPPPEEQERLYREMQEKGGLSFEEYFESLIQEFEPQP
jgi:hypothetical protein